MFRVEIRGFEKKELVAELINEFLRPDQYEFVEEAGDLVLNRDGCSSLNDIKREAYKALAEKTGLKPDWGILTGVRPVKLAGELMREAGGYTEAREILLNDYLLSEDKARLILDMYSYQIESLGKPEPNSSALYIGIPFCPTRCLYCSFASNQVGGEEMEDYLRALNKELAFTGEEMKRHGMAPESIYIGGGTPTSLGVDQLKELLSLISENFRIDRVKEFTCEAGRPDTIDPEKLKALKEAGVERISINPQSMKDRTLELIGRNHSTEDIRRAFREAGEIGFNSINCDLIAGLPEEGSEDVLHSIEEVHKLGADNITLHSLAVKRASRLKEQDPVFNYRRDRMVREAVMEGRRLMLSLGYKPYYLYRQKHMAGACDNTGYSFPGKEGLYNVRIMDEHQHVIALGAGGISKIYFPEENRLERIANVSNYRQYIDRIDEMIMRKKENFFGKLK